MNKFLATHTEDHKLISSFISYKCDDGDNIVVESYKLIQVKCSVMQYFNSHFKWSGKEQPNISSDLQKVHKVKSQEESTEYDYAVLEFDKPVLYNETAVVHFCSKSNDVNHQSLPYLELPIRYPIEYVQINISLGYKGSDYNQTAKVSKRLICDGVLSALSDYETITSISFDPIHKQYQYRLINPKVGYFYKISWER